MRLTNGVNEIQGRGAIDYLDNSSFGGVAGKKPDWNGYKRERRRIEDSECKQLLSYFA